ncbi:manganese transport system ATP-binding protein MntA [Klebsiella pneumoniae]|nr:manganese transport system ATP-binding protein MntA [Klebsiella pneumoniae]
MNAAQAGLYVDQLTVTWRNGHTALRDASFSVPRGSIAALVGVNGSGKSTLFKALMGFVRVGHGEIAILGQPVNRALRQNLVAYVPQSEEVDWSFPVLVEDVVMMGRYGHMGWLRRAKPRDREIVDAALARGHERVPPSADWRALRRAEKARLSGPRHRSAGSGDPAG